MKILNYEIHKITPDSEIKNAILNKAEQNAKAGLVTAKLELSVHELMLQEAPENNRTEYEIKGYEEAIERDKKSINNWQTQLRAINYERNT